MTKMTTSFERATIIGYWRNGAQLKEIADIMRLHIDEVFEVIMNYFED